MLMLQSKSVFSFYMCICSSTVVVPPVSLVGGVWTVGLLALTLFPGASCCFAALLFEGYISKVCLYATQLMAVPAVIRSGQLAACCTTSCVVLHASLVSIMTHLACVFDVAVLLQP